MAHGARLVGRAEAPWWWVLGVLAVGGLAVAGAIRLPGHGGHHPLDPLSFDIGPAALGSTLLAALATLAAGAVVGPEAPLLAIGTAIAFASARGGLRRRARARDVRRRGRTRRGDRQPADHRDPHPRGRRPDGGVAHRRTVVLVRLMPVVVALGAGYLMRVGVGAWTGLSSHPLDLGALEPYPTVRVRDLLPALAVALVTALLLTGVTRGARLLRPRVTPCPGSWSAAWSWACWRSRRGR